MKINGKNFILLHGHKLKHSQLNKEITALKMRLYEGTGIMADFSLLGHVHQTLIAPMFARSGSLVGENSYSSVGLNIPSSRASQNLIFVGDDIEVVAINLD